MRNKKLKLARIEKDMNQLDLTETIGVTLQTNGMRHQKSVVNVERDKKCHYQKGRIHVRVEMYVVEILMRLRTS